jgi:aminopeptidase
MKEHEFSQMLEKYADVIVKIGLNLQPGQRLIIFSDICDAPLVRQVTRSAYEAGAMFVDVVFEDSHMMRARIEYATGDGLTEGFVWQARALLEYLDKGGAFLWISAVDPDLFQGLDAEKVSFMVHAFGESWKPVLSHWRKFTINRCVVVGTNLDWAAKVYPDTPKEDLEKRILETIFKMCRIDQPDPVASWEKHIADLTARCKYMNAKNYQNLELKADGTNLVVGLPNNHIWSCERLKSQNGIENTVNIPTEENFTLPHKEKTEGTVKITRPINFFGELVEGVTLTFENGRVNKMSADKGESFLQELMNRDEDASYLGEVALVPHSSPISQSGLIFYNVLYDENAASHIALGSAYRASLMDGNGMSDDEFVKNGGNVSDLHRDCMIGSSDMDIDGISADGTREAVMRSGEWAFSV